METLTASPHLVFLHFPTQLEGLCEAPGHEEASQGPRPRPGSAGPGPQSYCTSQAGRAEREPVQAHPVLQVAWEHPGGRSTPAKGVLSAPDRRGQCVTPHAPQEWKGYPRASRPGCGLCAGGHPQAAPRSPRSHPWEPRTPGFLGCRYAPRHRHPQGLGSGRCHRLPGSHVREHSAQSQPRSL